LVVRASGERTQSVSMQLARLQVPPGTGASLVSEVPFESALRATYEEGIRAARQWTITLDADVLPGDGGILRLLEDALKMPSHFFELRGRIYDKVTGAYRPAGHHIYRTELLPRALRRIPKPGSQLQPEYFTVLQMWQMGHPCRQVGAVVGLHDFEQSYCDLYRKAIVHSRKMSFRIAELIGRCAERLHDDADFLVILKGLWDGLMTREALAIDRRQFAERALQALRELGLQEKASLENEERFVAGFPEMLAAVVSRHPAPRVTVIDDPGQPDAAGSSRMAKARRRIQKYGLIRGGASSLGALLKLIGERLD
jgi:hypothetical protein